jgi:hypothetical protein
VADLSPRFSSTSAFFDNWRDFFVFAGMLHPMDDDFDAPEVWDEFQWERFLKQQDQKTEKYFGLMEKYLDHPNRDAIIAQEMGWEAHAEANWDEFEEEFDECSAEMDELSQMEEEDEDELSRDVFSHPAFEEAMSVHYWIEEVITTHSGLSEHPLFASFVGRFATCSAKLAGALFQDSDEELGMVIAFLKRGLKAANDSLALLEELTEKNLLTREEADRVKIPLFSLRQVLVDLMGENRAEWLRRYGPRS